MKSLSSILFIILFCISCSEPELVLDNELDPDNPDYLPPETTILYTNPSLIDGVLDENSVTVYWEGNDPDMEFQFKLDDGAWSEWSSVFFGTFNYLNEGNHTALVQSRYLSGTVEDWPDTLLFNVDAIQGSSLRIHRLYTEVAVSDIFTVDIMAEEVNALSGAGITISFPSDGLSFAGDTLTAGPFFSQYPNQILYFYSESQSAGLTTLQLDIATLDVTDDYFSGTGVIAVLEFRADAVGEHDIEFDGATTTLRNANNVVIPYDELVDGTVNVE
jgi:hypothetical protein